MPKDAGSIPATSTNVLVGQPWTSAMEGGLLIPQMTEVSTLDQRQFWNPTGTFVEAGLNYLRRPGRSGFWTVCVVLALITISIGILSGIVLIFIQVV